MVCGWKPPGLDDIQSRGEDSGEPHGDIHPVRHDHSDNIDMADLVTDSEHIIDDLGEMYSMKDFDKMTMDEKVFMWFNAHDWDTDSSLDGLELLKALSHDHNYHHLSEEQPSEVDSAHDPAQHTESAEKQRFRRTVRIVDTLLEDHDPDRNGCISFPEFMSAYHAGKLEGLKLRQIQKKSD